MMILLPLMAILSIPVIYNFDSLYEWTDTVPTELEISHDKENSDYKVNDPHPTDNHEDNFWDYHKTMVVKKTYLNKSFFFIRLSYAVSY